MNINRDNYESWFLDYLDGTLDAGLQEKLMSFLDFNPDLKEELEGMERVNLEAEMVNFQGKETLKKSVLSGDIELITDDFDSLCISGIELQLSPAEENLMRDLLKKDPEKKKIYELFESTLLTADKNITYPKKSLLRKRFVDIPRVRIAVSIAAASAVILLAVSGLFRNPEGQEVLTGNMEIITNGDEGHEKATTEETTQHQPAKAQQAPEKIFPPETTENQAILTDQLLSLRITLMKIKPKKAEFLSLTENDEQRMMAYQLHDNSRSGTDLPVEVEPKKNRLNLWKLADVGLEKINEISEEDYSLERVVDEQGQTKRFTFESPIFGISTPMGNPNPPR